MVRASPREDEWMPQVIARYRATNPRIKVELFNTLAAAGIAMLREGRVGRSLAAKIAGV